MPLRIILGLRRSEPLLANLRWSQRVHRSKLTFGPSSQIGTVSATRIWEEKYLLPRVATMAVTQKKTLIPHPTLSTWGSFTEHRVPPRRTSRNININNGVPDVESRGPGKRARHYFNPTAVICLIICNPFIISPTSSEY